MAESTDTLGGHLRLLRRLAGLTLRAVEAYCGISNAYLSQVERDRVKRPSTDVLRALASCYGADYTDLLRRAGHLLPPDGSALPPVTFVGAEQLTEDERAEIQEIIALKLRRRRATQIRDGREGTSNDDR